MNDTISLGTVDYPRELRPVWNKVDCPVGFAYKKTTKTV
jgi:hypothetical protein